MKSTGTSLWLSPNQDATNSSGFTGFPGGFRDHYNGEFDFIGKLGSWWSSSEDDTSLTEDGTSLAWFCYLYDTGTAYRTSLFKNYGFSVRCLRD